MARRRLKEVINSTGRRNIRERDVSLTLVPNPPTARVVEVKLPEVDDPEWASATVYVEASQSRTASFDRYSIGKVADLKGRKPVDVRQLQNFSDASDAVFAVKVVAANGRILASGDDIRPDERRLSDKEALLQVKARPLGERPWTVEIEATGQTFLVVNSRIPDAETWIEQDAIAAALVLPAALRVVLKRLVADADFQSTDWGGAWKTWTALRAPSPMPDLDEDDDEQDAPDEWIDQVIDTFCKEHSSATKLIARMEKPEASE